MSTFTLPSSGGSEHALGMGPRFGFMSRTNGCPHALAWGSPDGYLIFQFEDDHWTGNEVSCLSPSSCDCSHSRFRLLVASQVTAAGRFKLYKFRVLGVYEYPVTNAAMVPHAAVLVQALDESFVGSLILADGQMGLGMLFPSLSLP